jgi:UV DNA damage endonuclease
MIKHIWGYACISEISPNIKTGSTSTMKYINGLAPQHRGNYIRKKIEANLANLPLLFKRNISNGIFAYRIPDSLMPFADLGYYSIHEYADSLYKCGALANELDIHLSFHPGQYFVLNSATPHVVENSIRNFNIYAEILEMMCLKNHPTLLTHVGALKTYPNRLAAVDAFCKNFEYLSPAAQKYFAVENDQSCHSIDSCAQIHINTGIPVVCDTAHYAYNPVVDTTVQHAINIASTTWGNRIPKVHLSSEREPTGRHAHAEYIHSTDAHILLDALTTKSIIMVESKKKDLSVLRILKEVYNV